MDILIIGGTKFLGRAISEELINRGHNLTLFHRGETNPEFLPEVNRILGDRETDIEKLGNTSWDAVIDTCGYYPRIVEISTNYLKDKTKQYVFISSISVYEDSIEIGRKETATIQQLEDPSTEDMSSEENAYGGLKALCEDVVQNTFGSNRSLIIRPGLIVGPHDPTNRFTYWPIRIRNGGDIIAPGDGSFPLQFIDVRDLGDFIIDMIENMVNETFNVTGPVEPIRLDKFLDFLRDEFDSDADLHWVDKEWLAKHEISGWMDLPLWLPSKEGRALMQVSVDRALDNGLKFRSLSTTVNDTVAWYDEIHGEDQEWPAGLTPSKEHDILDELLN